MDENKKLEKAARLFIDKSYVPVEYDPQYILMVNNLKKYFPIKDLIVLAYLHLKIFMKHILKVIIMVSIPN